MSEAGLVVALLNVVVSLLRFAYFNMSAILSPLFVDVAFLFDSFNSNLEFSPGSTGRNLREGERLRGRGEEAEQGGVKQREPKAKLTPAENHDCDLKSRYLKSL